jgi:hypothetical protein
MSVSPYVCAMSRSLYVRRIFVQLENKTSVGLNATNLTILRLATFRAG